MEHTHISSHISRLCECTAFNKLCADTTQTGWPSPTADRGERRLSTRANTALYQVLDDILMVTTIFVKQAGFCDCFDYSLLVICSSSSSSSNTEASCATYHGGRTGTKSPVRLRPINQVRSPRSNWGESGTAGLLLCVVVLRPLTSSFVESVIKEW